MLDETAVKKLVLNFEKKALKNREMRIKFPDQPEKFMESEIDLFEALQVNILLLQNHYATTLEWSLFISFAGLITLVKLFQELSAVATVPDQYPLLVELKCINSLLELLSHDNTDVSTKVVNLLQVSHDIVLL